MAVASITSTASVTTSTPSYNNCSQSASQASVVCQTPLADANVYALASSFASLGNLAVTAGVGGSGNAFGESSASASYDSTVLIQGDFSGTLTALYRISITTFATFTLFGGEAGAAATQDGIGPSVCHSVTLCPPNDLYIITSHYQPGVPIEMRGSVFATAGSPGDERTTASVTFLGFTDAATGANLSFSVVVPEPPTYVSGTALLILLALFRRRGGRA